MSGETNSRLPLTLSARTTIVIALAVGCLARILAVSYAFDWNAPPLFGDGITYVQFAGTLASTGVLASHHHPVGYPLFLGAVFASFGKSFALVRSIQIVAGLVTILATAAVARRLWGETASVISAWGMAVYPPLLYMTGRIMSETLFLCLLTVSLHLWLEWEARGGRNRSVWAGAFLALAFLFRSNLLPLAAFVPIWQMHRNRARARRPMEGVLLSLVVMVLILAAPGAYFLGTQGEFAPLPTNSGKTFIGANNPQANGGWVSIDQHPELVASLPPQTEMSEAAYSRALTSLGVRWIRDNPGDFLALLPRKLANAWVPGMQRSGVTDESSRAALVLTLSYGALSLLALAGVLTARRPRAPDGLMLGVLVVYTVVSLAFYGNPRLGLVCAPILIVYGAAFVARHLPDYWKTVSGADEHRRGA